MTLEDLERVDRDYLTPEQIAPILHVTQYSVSLQVRQDKERGINSFPFPTIMIGTRVKIPKMPFLKAMKGE